jgi:inner membrane transporter RhtA
MGSEPRLENQQNRFDVVRLKAERTSVPPIALVFTAMISLQVGAAVAKTLFDQVGPAGVVMLRLVFGATAIALVWRPRIRSGSRGRGLLLIGAFAATLASMNLAFYGAIERIPLGIAVTLEFVGPLAVAILGSRRLLDFVWVGLSAAGIVLLAGAGEGSVHLLGVILALVAGGFWASYIVLGARVGRIYPGPSGLAVAMSLAALLVAPVGIASGGSELLSGRVLIIGAAIGVLSSAIPWSLEIEALRRLPTHTFGVLMSLEPALAALAGLAILGQRLGPAELVAIALVVVACAGVSWSGGGPSPREP